MTVVKKTKRRQGHNVMWLCKCACGKKNYVSTRSLNMGKSASCGCKGQYPENPWRSMPWIVIKNGALHRQSRATHRKCYFCGQWLNHRQNRQTKKPVLCRPCKTCQYWSTREHTVKQRRYFRDRIIAVAKRYHKKLDLTNFEERFQKWHELNKKELALQNFLKTL